MAEGGKWETVTSKSKKPANKAKPNGKAVDSKYTDALQGPVIESKTLFGAFTPKERKEKAPTGSQSVSEQVEKKSGIPKLQKKDGPVRKNPATKLKLETYVPTLTNVQFEDILAKCQAIFKDSPVAWLRELTAQLNSMLDTIPMPDPVHADKPEDFPSSLLASGVKKLFNKVIQECKPEALHMFLEQLLISVMGDMTKGLSVYGYQMVAQLVARQRPEIFSLNLPKHLGQLINNKNYPARCRAVLWIIGQGGQNDFKLALKIWIKLMLPLLGVKTLAGYVVSYLGQILEKAGKKIEHGYDVIEMKDFFLILDGIYSPGSNIQPAILKQMKDYYPILKRLSLGRNPAQTLPRYFPSFLTRLSADGANVELQRELLSNITQCLETSSSCFTDWTSIYAKYLPQSSVLLNHIANSLENRAIRVDLNALQDAVARFCELNDEITKTTPGAQMCRQACQRFEVIFQARSHESTSIAKYMLLLCLLVMAGLVYFDCYQSGGYQRSKTRQLMRDSGADVLCIKLYSQISNYISMCTQYLYKNFPGWMETAIVYIEPVATAVWTYTLVSVQYLAEITSPARLWIQDNIPLYMDKVIALPVWSQLYDYTASIYTALRPYVLPVLEVCLHYLEQVRLAVAKLLV